MDTGLLEAARTYFPDCDWIVNLFDLHFEWASPKALEQTGYSIDEIKTMRNIDIADDKYEEMQLRRELFERVAKSHGSVEYDIKHRNGSKLHALGEYHVFVHDGVWYIVGKLNSLTPISR